MTDDERIDEIVKTSETLRELLLDAQDDGIQVEVISYMDGNPHSLPLPVHLNRWLAFSFKREIPIPVIKRKK
jgi:hypothetical protein